MEPRATSVIPPARALGHALLRDVSRSFYLSLRLLPAEVRDATSCAYLLARLSDTLADHETAPATHRRAWLEAFLRVMEAATPTPLLLTEHPLDLDHPGEKELIQRRDELFQWFWAQPAEEKHLIRHVLRTIVSGQMEDLDRTQVGSPAELHHYTWQVAGCVGEFWTRLHFLRVSGFSQAPEEQMVALGIRYGQGLQLVNILRDVAKDARLGRCYIPGGPFPHPQAHWEAMQPWITQCREHLSAGERWVSAVRPYRCRLAAQLPLLLAWETLEALDALNIEALQRPAKVPRSRVKWLLLAALVRAGVRST